MSGIQRVPIHSLVLEGRHAPRQIPQPYVWNLNLDQIESDTGKVLSKQMVSVEELGSSTHPFESGTVLYSKLRPYLNKVVVADADGVATTELVPLRCHPDKLLPQYLAYFLRSAEFLSFANTVVAGAKMPRMVMGEFWNYKIPLPPLPEQRRIAAILDKADALRAKRRAALAQLDELTQSIFIEMFGDPAANPKGFPVKTLGSIIKFEGGSQPPASTFTFEDGPDRIRLIQIRDFKTDRFKTYIPRSLCKRFFDEDDVMIGRYGPPVFQILRGLAGSYNVALMKAVPRADVTKDFIFHLLQEKRLHNFVVANSERTAGQSGVNLELLENYQAYLPPLELQLKFSDRLARQKAMSKYMADSNVESEALFSSLQHRAFRGEL